MNPTTSAPKHRARPTILTRHRERVAEREHHMWAAQGLERPTYIGLHAAVPVSHPNYMTAVSR